MEASLLDQPDLAATTVVGYLLNCFVLGAAPAFCGAWTRPIFLKEMLAEKGE
jgi:hypothetical protein